MLEVEPTCQCGQPPEVIETAENLLLAIEIFGQTFK